MVLRSDTLAACADRPTTRSSRPAVGAITGPGAAGQTHRARGRVRRLSRRLGSPAHHQPGPRHRPTGRRRPAGREPLVAGQLAPSQQSSVRALCSGVRDSRVRDSQVRDSQVRDRRVRDRRVRDSRVRDSRVRGSLVPDSLVVVRCSCLATTAAGHRLPGRPPASAVRQPTDPPGTVRRPAGPQARARSAGIRQSPVSRRRCTRLASSRRGTGSRADRGIRPGRCISQTAAPWSATAPSATNWASGPIPATRYSR